MADTSPFSANPFAFVFAILAFGGAALYFAYGAVDRFGLDEQTAPAVVTGKQFTPGSTTYNTSVTGGRTWTQANENPDVYAISLTVEGEPTVGVTTKDVFDALNAGERVRATIRRTRLSGRLEVVDISPER